MTHLFLHCMPASGKRTDNIFFPMKNLLPGLGSILNCSLLPAAFSILISCISVNSHTVSCCVSRLNGPFQNNSYEGMIRTKHAPLHIAAVTHPGMGGKQNEDRHAVSSYRISGNRPDPLGLCHCFGWDRGHLAGEIAAEMAVETISHMVAQSDGRRPLEILDNAIQVVSDAIATKAKDNTQRLGMGTTCACAWVIGNRLFTASVGDQRIYLSAQWWTDAIDC